LEAPSQSRAADRVPGAGMLCVYTLAALVGLLLQGERLAPVRPARGKHHASLASKVASQAATRLAPGARLGLPSPGAQVSSPELTGSVLAAALPESALPLLVLLPPSRAPPV